MTIPTGKPTLKDYLKIMKENKNDASAAYAAINFPGKNADDKPGIDDPIQKIQNDLPAIRPAPVGSESIEPPVSGMFQQNIVSHQPAFHGAMIKIIQTSQARIRYLKILQKLYI